MNNQGTHQRSSSTTIGVARLAQTIAAVAILAGCAVTYRTVEPAQSARPNASAPTESDVIDAARKGLPPNIAAATVLLLQDKSWKQTKQEARPFVGRVERRYYDQSSQPELNQWVLASTGADARRMCDLTGVSSTDPCDGAYISDTGLHVYFSERDGTDIRVATSDSARLSFAIGKSMTWDTSLVPSIDTSLLPSGLTDHGLWRVEGGGMVVPADVGGAAYTWAEFEDTTTEDGSLDIETIGTNVPYVAYRLGYPSDSTFTDVTVDGFPALLVERESFVMLLVNYDGGFARLHSINTTRGAEMIRSLIDPG